MMRADDFNARRQEIANLNDTQLRDKFWQLTDEVIKPLLELARTHTSPSIERSILLRMGFSSLETQVIVAKCVEYGLLSKGAGNVVWRLAQLESMEIRAAGLALAEGQHWEGVKAYFAREVKR
ncbi:MAG: ornithine aminomutase subunit alpha [Peptococcaceae bacterium]|nr:ornithine aminomutase subunit alpha [Peptococcaceae bacterium]